LAELGTPTAALEVDAEALGKGLSAISRSIDGPTEHTVTVT
jgi:hypothetical protein